jgi:predicted  nucleic acid-binding Zn-ribbon protein
MRQILASLGLLGLLLGTMVQGQNSDSLGIASDQAGSTDKLDQLMGRAQKRLEYIMTNLNELTDGNDKNNNFDNFKDNLEELKSIRDDIKDRVEKVRDLQGKRIAAWTKEVSGMNDKDMRKLTNDQIDKAKADFDGLDKQMREIGGDANDLTGLLDDLQKYFASSFSSDSVNAAKDRIEKAKTSARDMVKDVDALRDTLYKNKKIVKAGFFSRRARSRG